MRRRVKGASETLAVQVVGAVARMRDSDVQKPPGIAEAIDWLRALELLGVDAARRRPRSTARSARCSSTARTRTSSAPPGLESLVSRVETVELDLPPLVAAFGRRLHEAGVPVTPERSARFAAGAAR